MPTTIPDPAPGHEPMSGPAVVLDFDHFAMIPEGVIYHPDLGATAVRVYCALVRHAGRGGDCYPSVPRLADLCRCSVDSVRRAKKQLTDAGVLIVEERRTDRGDRASDRYRLVDPDSATPPRENGGTPPHDSATTPPRENGGGTRVSSNESQLERETDGVGPHGGGLDVVAEDPFDAAWALYPRKLNRKGAAKAWATRVKAGDDPEAMHRAVVNYARLRAGKDPTLTMHGSTFFGPNERWRDYADGIPDDDVARPERRESERQRKQRRAVEEMQRHAANRQELPA